ncbi:uncharacterized protein A1O5_07434 [Cladophialophora psammophila CBS 110553]|uniref:Xylanolytic transcriptional activator regulatory domain-containing protein n=1 Tax=Cladophialophora psammophila CBS 110553 TaxID=1182543 RepID=W9WNF5_9EURO|nr:uncharacterized protein A1O5_07434 [Cladophialophora psammophila CBS 110553]EXJ69398.1 hypothetical protein A1O5_07434 [Cladophialophora psammophila CBS 110553]
MPKERAKLSSVPPPLAQSSYIGVPPALLRDLVETYFSHAYNAPLLLHKQTFLREVSEGTVKASVALAVCAFASNFHRNSNGDLLLKSSGFGVEWAERAGKLVFDVIESPQEDNVITCLILALFWYNQGSWQRSYILKGNAIQTAHLLGMGRQPRLDRRSLSSELRRRRFWACYLIECHASNSTHVLDASEQIYSLPLPCTEEEFENGISEQPDVFLACEQSTGGIFCEMIRALWFWAQVYSLIKTPELQDDVSIHDIGLLDTKISEWWSRIPDWMKLNPGDLARTPPACLPRLLLVHAVYRQCLCALHSSIVPLFSWGHDGKSSLLARQISAQVAYEHASAASELFSTIFDYLPDPNAMPSFVAYNAYCGCAIQVPFMSSPNPAVRERAIRNVEANRRVIHLVAQSWKYADLLDRYSSYLLAVFEKHPVSLAGEPKHLESSTFRELRAPAPRVRLSILAHNRMVCEDDCWSLPGEEPKDLDIEPRQEGQSMSPSGGEPHAGAMVNRNYAAATIMSGEPQLHNPTVQFQQILAGFDDQLPDASGSFLSGTDIFVPWSSSDEASADLALFDMGVLNGTSTDLLSYPG